jgi:hypothetical protein
MSEGIVAASSGEREEIRFTDVKQCIFHRRWVRWRGFAIRDASSSNLAGPFFARETAIFDIFVRI